jgi:hypothetical protein
LQTPHLNRLTLQALKRSDLDILVSCRNSLEVFICEYEGSKKRKHLFLEELLSSLNMLTAFHTLTLDLRGPFYKWPTEDWKERQDYQRTLPFWDAFLSEPKTCSSIKKLILSESSYTRKEGIASVPADKLVAWLTNRKQAGHPLDTLILHGFKRYTFSSMLQLTQLVPHLTYSSY